MFEETRSKASNNSSVALLITVITVVLERQKCTLYKRCNSLKQSLLGTRYEWIDIANDADDDVTVATDLLPSID